MRACHTWHTYGSAPPQAPVRHYWGEKGEQKCCWCDIASSAWQWQLQRMRVGSGGRRTVLTPKSDPWTPGCCPSRPVAAPEELKDPSNFGHPLGSSHKAHAKVLTVPAPCTQGNQCPMSAEVSLPSVPQRGAGRMQELYILHWLRHWHSGKSRPGLEALHGQCCQASTMSKMSQASFGTHDYVDNIFTHSAL